MAENNIDFRYPSYKTSWDPCVLIMDLVPLDGFVQENQKIYTDDIACAVLEEMAKNRPNSATKCKIISNGLKARKKINSL
jgi:hypothetical protein